MTAPTTAASAVASINADIAAVQARIASIQAGPAISGVSTTSGSSSSTGTFADALSSAEPTSSAMVATGSSNSGVTGSAVVADAEKYLGVPYVWGGESRSGMDCSGLVQQTYKDLGISLPRVAADQQKVGQAVPSLADAQPGDLLFFGQPAYHVAIYLGNNQLIESPEPGKTVHITDVYQTPTSIRRIVPSSSDTAGLATAVSGSGGLSAGQLTSAGLVLADGVTAEGFDSVMHLHVRAALFGMKYAAPLMRAAGGGSIISTASVATCSATLRKSQFSAISQPPVPGTPG